MRKCPRRYRSVHFLIGALTLPVLASVTSGAPRSQIGAAPPHAATYATVADWIEHDDQCDQGLGKTMGQRGTAG